jgi:predicted dehydrogenase
MAAMRTRKGAYCEKPVTHSIGKARQFKQAARQHSVATQMGHQGHSTDDIRRAVEWIRAGDIGAVAKCTPGAAAPTGPCHPACAVRLADIVLLAVVALRTGRTLNWDAERMAAADVAQAEACLRGHFRKG